MDLSDTATNILFVLGIAFLIAINLFLKSRRQVRKPAEMVLSLLSEINHNQKLVEDFQFHLNVKKFKTENWKTNKTKVDFLGQSLLTTLDTAFSMTENFNHDIDTAKKYKSTSYLTVISVDKLKELLAKSKQGLEEWLQVNVEKPQLARRQG
jgi:hypothetical protein